MGVFDNSGYDHGYNEKYHREILIGGGTNTQLYSLLMNCRKIYDCSNYDNWSMSLGLIDQTLDLYTRKSDIYGDDEYSDMLLSITQEYKISIIDKMLQQMSTILLHKKIKGYKNNIKNLLQNNLIITKRG